MRVDPSDADFVDVIHTSGRDDILGLGLLTPVGKSIELEIFDKMPQICVGDVDFYPNGGQEQPSCFTKTSNKFLKWLLFPLHCNFLYLNLAGLLKNPTLCTIVFEAITCSHGIACDYFIESIALKNCKFWGHNRDRASIK